MDALFMMFPPGGGQGSRPSPELPFLARVALGAAIVVVLALFARAVVLVPEGAGVVVAPPVWFLLAVGGVLAKAWQRVV